MKKAVRTIWRWLPTAMIFLCMLASTVNYLAGDQLHELRWFASAMFWMLIEGWRRLGAVERRANVVLSVLWDAMHEERRKQPAGPGE